MTAPRTTSPLLALLCAIAASGCLTVGRVDPPPAPLPAPATAPRIEYALGEFTFRMNDGDPRRSYFDARLLTAAIVDVWVRRGYVSEAVRVDAGAFSARAGGRVVFGGSVRAESSFWAELLNALTLTAVPYAVTTQYTVQVAAQPRPGGAPLVARARSADRTWIGLLLIVGLPVAERGHDEEMARVADALYTQLAAQGAFAQMDSGGG